MIPADQVARGPTENRGNGGVEPAPGISQKRRCTSVAAPWAGSGPPARWAGDLRHIGRNGLRIAPGEGTSWPRPTLLCGDLKTRCEGYAIARQNGILSADERSGTG